MPSVFIIVPINIFPRYYSAILRIFVLGLHTFGLQVLHNRVTFLLRGIVVQIPSWCALPAEYPAQFAGCRLRGWPSVPVSRSSINMYGA